MSYTIFYDKFSIKTQRGFIPMFQYGDNNVFDISATGRQIPSKNWCSIFAYWSKERKIFFKDKQETRVFLEEYLKNDADVDIFKSRNRMFSKQEYINFCVNSLNKSFTVEQLIEWGNDIIVYSYQNKMITTITSEQHLFEVLDKNQEILLEIALRNRKLRYPKDETTTKARKYIKNEKIRNNGYYYILYLEFESGVSGYFYKLTKTGVKVSLSTYGNARFVTEKEAQKYFDTKIKGKFRVSKYEIRKMNVT